MLVAVGDTVLPVVILLVLWGLFTVVVLAAVMSTADRLMLTIGTYFSWDFYRNVIRPEASDDQVLLVSKIAMAATAVITVMLALDPPAMRVWLIWAGIGIMFATICRSPPRRTLLGKGPQGRGIRGYGARPRLLVCLLGNHVTSRLPHCPSISAFSGWLSR